ncbi:MAG: PLP-dependent aminotransferase family protein [Coriobacteriia bacterium]|nr:PLP-dependent aminotransferase family protein [Coriobacteriia bacterium]MBN2822221.1 PLP-dependent aminotransferase family protein [Coriobacteriia bacterium]
MGTARIVFDRWDGRYAQRMGDVRSSATRDLFAAASRSDIISFAGGMPEISRVPADAVASAAAEAIRDFGSEALQYGSSEGRPQLRGTIVELMAEIGVRARQEDIIVTAGAQQALDLLAKIFLDPGDVIITEGPTYLGALQAFSAYQPRVICVPMDEQGMDTDVLAAELAALGPRGAKFIYTIPNFQNPGGVTMSAERRRKLLELAREYDIPVIEDDPYGRLRFDGGHMRPLRALDEDVIYLGTFSKIFAPGLRLGWVIAPRPILGKVLLAKQAADLCGSAYAQITAERYFAGTRWRRVLRDLTRVYGERRDAMLEALEEHFPAEAEWTVPEGGFFVWVRMPVFLDLKALLPEAIEHGVTYVAGDAFFPDGRTGRNCMRLAFCYAAPDAIREGIRRLAEVVEDRLELYRAFQVAGALPDTMTAREVPA